MKKLSIEQQELLQQMVQGNDLREITPFKALEMIKKQVGNIHVFTDEMPPQQTTIELRNSGLFEIVDKELWESIKNRGWIKELLECKQKLEDIEELVNIPFAKISNLKVGDVVYFRMGRISEGEVININYEELIITILDEKMTLTDFMLFHQYGKDRQSPSHCWMGAWALTREELEK